MSDENAYDILARVRDALLSLVDPTDHVCGDMLACTVSEPECVIHLADQIVKQHKKQQKDLDYYKNALRIAEGRLNKELDKRLGDRCDKPQIGKGISS